MAILNGNNMKLTDEQVQSIVDDIVSKMEAIIEDPCDGDYSDFECYEDEYGRCSNYGTHTLNETLEEICIDGLPGIPADDSDIYISADYVVDIDFHDDYDPGDYWTPSSGGIEFDNVKAYIEDVDVEISALNQETDEYEDVEVSDEQIEFIVEKVNEKICPTSKKVVA